MFRKLGALSVPATPQEPPQQQQPSSKAKSQKLIICSAGMSDVAKSALQQKQQLMSSPPAPHEVDDQLMFPAETVINILDGFAKSLLVDRERLSQLKATCLNDDKLPRQEEQKGSILKNTLLTYMSWGIEHIEKAASVDGKDIRAEHLKKAEQILMSLTDSMAEDQLDQSHSSRELPNASSSIVGLAHVLLALVWKLKKTSTRSVASHLLQAFVVCPKNARHSFASELWEQLFRTQLSGVEAWYRKEHSNIVTNYSRSFSASIRSSSDPMRPTAAVARAHSVMDLVSGMNREETTSCSSMTEQAVSEKINMQVNLLYDRYEESLDEGTQRYAKHYQDLIVSYYERLSDEYHSSSRVLVQRDQPQPSTTTFRQEEMGSRAIQAEPAVEQDDSGTEYKGSTSEGGRIMGANGLQLRRSVYEAVFGTVSILEKTKKKGAWNQASLIRLCNKALPQVFHPMRNKLEDIIVFEGRLPPMISSGIKGSASSLTSLTDDASEIAVSPKVEQQKNRFFLGNSMDLIEDGTEGNFQKFESTRMSISGANVDRTIEDQMRVSLQRSFSNAERTIGADGVVAAGAKNRRRQSDDSKLHVLHVDDKADVDTVKLEVSGAHLQGLVRELREAVSATRCGTRTSVVRCEKVLLRLSQAWLDCKSTTTLESEDKGGALDGLMDELLFILSTSELHEAQRLALCLLSALVSRRKGQLQDEQGTALSSDPQVLQALSHLLQQHGRLPEATLLLHLLHPGKYSAACHDYLPHLLPLLLDLAQRNPSIDNCTTNTSSPFTRATDTLNSRPLAFIMMSRLLSGVDRISHVQSCKHILYPNALPCLLHSLDCAFTVEERAAAAFILTTCMQADDMCRQCIVREVKVTTVVSLLQQSASSRSAFQTAINFVTEVLASKHRRTHLTEMLGRIRQDGVLNCMHALMSYLQTASVENQPQAAGLLLQLDLCLGDEERYSLFREEALEALVAPLFSENNKEASFNVARVLVSTIGRSHSGQELEAWLLKKAGLAMHSHYNSALDNRSSCADEEEEEEEEEESAAVAEWDGKVARAFIRQGGGQLVSLALAKGLRSSTPEVRKACLMVAAWLSSHLNMGQLHNYMSAAAQAATAERMREALQPELHAMAALGSGCAIDERVFAALALQNLGIKMNIVSK